MCAQTETTALHTAEIAVASQRAAEIELGYEDGTHRRIAKNIAAADTTLPANLGCCRSRATVRQPRAVTLPKRFLRVPRVVEFPDEAMKTM